MHQQVHFSDMKCALMLTSSFTCSKSSLWISFHIIGSVHISWLTSYEASFSEMFQKLSLLLLLTFTLLFLWLVLWCSTVCLVFLQQFPLIKLLDGPTTASTTPKRSLKENFSFPRNISYGNFFAFCIWLNIADCGQFVSFSLI